MKVKLNKSQPVTLVLLEVLQMIIEQFKNNMKYVLTAPAVVYFSVNAFHNQIH